MNEEEKKAIEYWKNYMDILKWDTQLACKHHMAVLLNLIENQQKEIEKLQVINQMQKYRIEVIDERELISRDEVENIIISEIKEIEKEQEEYKNGQEWEIQDELAGQKGVLQSILDKIKGDDK